jgi:hypothetical protein
MVYAMPVIVPHVAGTHAMVIQAVPVDALLHGAIEPAISPVRNVRVNGETADAPRTGIGRVPTISWEAPATGVATSYAVKVQAVTRSGQGYRLATVGTFRTRSTSLSLPEPAMGSVDSYVLTITAVASGDRDLTSRPRIGSLPYASADYVTAQLTR